MKALSYDKFLFQGLSLDPLNVHLEDNLNWRFLSRDDAMQLETESKVCLPKRHTNFTFATEHSVPYV